MPKRNLERAKQARSKLALVRLKLLDPTVEVFDSSAGELQLAAEYLGQLQSELEARPGPHSGDAELELEMLSMRQELRQVRSLVESAGRFYRAWAGLRTAVDDAPANYTAQGKSGGMVSEQPRRLALNG